MSKAGGGIVLSKAAKRPTCLTGRLSPPGLPRPPRGTAVTSQTSEHHHDTRKNNVPTARSSRRDFLSVVAGSTVAAIAPTVSASVFDSFP
jgi:hypothetical protein